MFFTKVDTDNVDLAMDVGNHNFEVEKQAIHTERNILIPDHVAIVRKDTNQYLGTVGSAWEPVQPKEIYELAEELIKYSGGSINGVFNMLGGSIIGISFTLATKEYVKGDPTDLNFLMINGFNGTHGIAGHATIDRASCLNQANTSNRVYSLKHTRYVANRLQVVKNMLKYYNREIKLFDEKMIRLVNTRMNDAEAIEWFESLFPKPKSPKGESRLENKVGIFLDCLKNGRGTEISGVRGTSYGAFQALTEYINHYQTTRIYNNREKEEVKFQSIHFGGGNTLTQKALNTLSIDNVDNDYIEFSEDEFIIE